MKNYYYMFNSITTAMKSETVLKNSGYRASVFRDTKINSYGCGYVVKVFGNKEEITSLLAKKGIRIREIKEAN